MHWILNFKKTTSKSIEEVPGFGIEKIKIHISSFNKRQDLIKIYSDLGYNLFDLNEVDEELATGLENMVFKSEYWLPDISSCAKSTDNSKNLADKALGEKRQSPIPIPAFAKPIDGDKICKHKFNCEAHKEICVGIYGYPEITTKPTI